MVRLLANRFSAYPTGGPHRSLPVATPDPPGVTGLALRDPQ
ncbi:MAG: hypothetical protein ACFB0C_14290 [Leptolyngbyaceae cyanobacterium]